jgi:hypothetical protein
VVPVRVARERLYIGKNFHKDVAQADALRLGQLAAES